MQGNKSFKFGTVERKASLNWTSIGISFLIAVLTWFGTDLIPQLAELHSGWISAIAGVSAQIIPMVILYLRNNIDLKTEEPKEPDA